MARHVLHLFKLFLIILQLSKRTQKFYSGIKRNIKMIRIATSVHSSILDYVKEKAVKVQKRRKTYLWWSRKQGLCCCSNQSQPFISVLDGPDFNEAFRANSETFHHKIFIKICTVQNTFKTAAIKQLFTATPETRISLKIIFYHQFSLSTCL